MVLLVVVVIHDAGLLGRIALAQQSNPNEKSWTDSVSSSVKSGFNKITHPFDSKPAAKTPTPEDDALSLKSKSKPGPDLHVAIARLYEQSGKLADADQQYQAALNLKRDYLPALLGYARLKELAGHSEAAQKIYQRAATVYPREASVHNNIGLFHARQNRLNEAAAAMTVAVQLDPKNTLYHNNLATVLVEQGRPREAFAQLRAVHDEAAAYYNMGYLLNKKGQTQLAMQHFAFALRADPLMEPAQQWLNYLHRSTTQARLPQHPTANGLRVTTDRGEPDAAAASQFSNPRPNRFQATSNYSAPVVERGDLPTPAGETTLRGAPLPPEPPVARRLPPLPPRESQSSGPSLPGMSYDRRDDSTVPSAPLPPPSSNPGVRYLPRVN
jgi:Tfp pilus assembly protein PilF